MPIVIRLIVPVDKRDNKAIVSLSAGECDCLCLSRSPLPSSLPFLFLCRLFLFSAVVSVFFRLLALYTFSSFASTPDISILIISLQLRRSHCSYHPQDALREWILQAKPRPPFPSTLRPSCNDLSIRTPPSAPGNPRSAPRRSPKSSQRGPHEQRAGELLTRPRNA